MPSGIDMVSYGSIGGLEFEKGNNMWAKNPGVGVDFEKQ
jgi:hypothetical protein